jgi:hypothetical protein
MRVCEIVLAFVLLPTMLVAEPQEPAKLVVYYKITSNMVVGKVFKADDDIPDGWEDGKGKHNQKQANAILQVKLVLSKAEEGKTATVKWP